jgi:hypothetical protein
MVVSSKFGLLLYCLAGLETVEVQKTFV